MALTANSATSEILVDTSHRVVALCILHQDTAGDESNVQKINVNALGFKTVLLSTANVTPTGGFTPGEKITGGTSGTIGYVVEWKTSTLTSNGTLRITNANGAFTNTETITGARAAYATTINGITNPQRALAIDSVKFSVTANGKLELAFANNGTVTPRLELAGNGYIGKNEMGGIVIRNNYAVTDGHLYVSTYGIGAKGGYTAIIELSKLTGFDGVPVA